MVLLPCQKQRSVQSLIIPVTQGVAKVRLIKLKDKAAASLRADRLFLMLKVELQNLQPV